MKPYITRKIYVMEILSYVCIVVSVIIAIVGMVVLPEKIATHFDMQGMADGYGSPASLLILPLIMLFSNGTMSLCMHVLPPDKWNVPCKIEKGQEWIVYRDKNTMIAQLELEIGIFTVFETIASYVRNGKAITLGVAPFIAVLTGTILCAIFKSIKHSVRR